jgi:hypothetical protein
MDTNSRNHGGPVLTTESKDPVANAKKSNVYVIQPIPAAKPTKPPLGYELFPQLKSSIYISAKTKSGKTTLINHIIKHCIGKKTAVYIFSPTVYIDDSYKAITKYLEENDVTHEIHQHFIAPDGTNILQGIVDRLLAEVEKGKKSRDQDTDERPGQRIPPYIKLVGGKPEYLYDHRATPPEPKEVKKQTKEPNAPKCLFVLDDLGNELRKPVIYQLLLKQRHFGKTIISSQYINNIMPNAIQQLDYVILYGGHNADQLDELHKKLDLSCDLEQFIEYYKYATAERYHFLYIDRREAIYKKDFDTILN